MALTISFVASGAGLSTFTTAGSALDENSLLTGGVGSIANNALNIVCDSTQSPAVTAYVTNVAFSQTIDGAPMLTIGYDLLLTGDSGVIWDSSIRVLERLDASLDSL